ncbi:Esterase/lipase/thioesterase family protein [Pseudomonas amygdali pv. ulmi]|uniref:Esterase/lipase/thioesterase protein n=8 Tax=Pseudomonas syringae group TaxID=136849 RepID=A0A3M5ZZQ1_PSESS|nr:Esterase/lipase/thioesterase family protein [Pseudomonas amygdali pv. aesculi]KPX09214.1 Esterase/lipase/thioesterase family protein [Pseudomonas syringae pv. cunninghamiae]KPY41779.1 Esterase/lipase/thioesterase family protein [Pseudomonas savastanoi pv. retacarpa]KPZ14836.1 Esterase/lipase/thioesterase family protein [Pseudomonas amygdali pv. ulmi]KUG40667.1 Esterase/lipase/thioesterase family protein [Pseudomonas savastanoi pv. fraxini]RML80741.1 Esterase/lipase/thioesterase protein [Pse
MRLICQSPSLMIRVIFLTLMTGAVLAALSGCSPLKLLNTLNPTGPVDHVYGVAYGQDPRNTLDVYTPQTKPANAPVVVFFYGGSWNTGSKANYAFVGEALAARGMVVVIADYRLYPQVRYPSFLEDSAKALAWAHKHAKTYGGDPDRLYVMGHSAGAYNAAMLALDPRWLAREGLSPSILSGWIGLAGPYDFLPIENADVKPVFFFPDSPPDSQPINHVSSSAPPALLMASNTDSLVNPKRNTGGLARALREAGVPVRDLYFSRTNHGTLVGAFAKLLSGLAPVVDEVDMFVNHTPQRLAEKNRAVLKTQ